MTRPEENLHYWKLLAEENGCYEQPYPFANDHARFLFFRQREPNLHYVPHEAFACRVTLLSGLPGSGKDTWLSRNRSDLPVVSLDDIRGELDVEPTDNQGNVVQLARERCREFLRAGRSFAFNATNILKQTRQRWIDLFADYNARIELVYIEPPFDRLLRQNKNRKNPVPEQVVRKLAAKCEPPTWTEGHALLLVDGETMTEGRIVIIPFLHGQVDADGSLIKPDIDAILEKWLQRHPQFRGRKFHIIRSKPSLQGGIPTAFVRVTVDFSPDLADYDPAEDADLYENFLAEKGNRRRIGSTRFGSNNAKLLKASRTNSARRRRWSTSSARSS
jgi:predicted kinase